MNGTLYIVPTPIGNLGDMTYRAVEVLQGVDLIACEDTRHSLVLLNRYQIRKPLVSFHKFNAAKTLPKLLARLAAGQNVALISDAGMPGISDPGAELVAAVREAGLPYTVLPGPTALINALVLSGNGGGGFAFCGFLPERPKDRRDRLSVFRSFPGPVIFYVSPHGIERDIADIYAVFGERKLFVVKELTKLNERVETTTLSAGLAEPPRGEYVLVVEGESRRNDLNDLTPRQHLQYYLDLGLDKREAVKQVAQDRGVPKNEIYQLTL